jgi:hypothetical protein
VPRYSQTMEELQENSDRGEDVDEDEIEEIKCNSQEGPRHLRQWQCYSYCFSFDKSIRLVFEVQFVKIEFC